MYVANIAVHESLVHLISKY